MTLAYVGKLALSAILPASVTAVASASASLSAALPVVSADLTAATNLSAEVTATPPNIATQISTVATVSVGLAAAVFLGVPLVDVQVSAVTALVAQLSPIVASISASLALTSPLASLFLEDNVQAWSFAGTSAELGGMLGASVSSGLADGAAPKQTIGGFILASTGGGTWVGMQTFFPPIPGSQAPHSLAYLGGLSLGPLFGLESAGILAANIRLKIELASLGARLEGAISAAAALAITPPTLLGNIALAADITASLYAVTGYIDASAAIAMAAQLVTDLTALTAQISADVSALASITSALATAGVLAFTYSGTSADLGASVNAAIAAGWPDGTPNTTPSNALILLASGSGTSAALGTIFGGL